ncbi:ZIP family metal transporter [Halosimplex salinum]|uniref:ZIP family metal transporter n=1 Tax=Halosimplex salinum TaxID=1710538 RepID=UPI000F49CCFE|nr:ZIP family metal transporter [Halosimplex salinum]
MVVQPLLFGIGTAIPLVLGAAIGVSLSPPRRIVGALLAFASGALLTGLAFELFEPAFRIAGPVLGGAALFAGTGLYVAVKRRADAGEVPSGFPLLAAVVFDGTAENLTLGISILGGSTGGSLAVLVGIAANNFPEAVAGAEAMTRSGRSRPWTFAVWTASAVGLAAVVVFGYVAFSGVGETVLALVRAGGGGAVLASLAVEIMPDAYREGGPTVAFATAAGLLVTFLLV